MKIIAHLKEKPLSTLAWHVWVIATIKALIEVRISRNKAGSWQKKGFDMLRPALPPLRFHSFKLVLRRQQIYFQFLCGAGKKRNDFFMKGECRPARTDTRVFFSRWVCRVASGMDTELKQQKSVCFPVINATRITSRQKGKGDSRLECFITVRT